MIRLFIATLLALVPMLSPASAQDDRSWIQVEALPSLLEAEERVRDYAEFLPNVNGFAVGSGWYAVALGPYGSRAAATTALRQLRGEGRVPRDSFVVGARALQQQFWPVGADARSAPPPEQPAETESAPAAPAAGDPEVSATQPQPEPEETVAEARRSEARMSAQARRDLQVALQWAGVYNAGIDGAFGAGTRRAMAAWQEARGYEPTGVMTTRQRAQALQEYNAVLDGMGLERVTDSQAGIEMLLPLGVVSFEAHEAPFARYTASGALEAPGAADLAGRRPAPAVRPLRHPANPRSGAARRPARAAQQRLHHHRQQ